ncbi:MAG: flavin reductase family protein [Anaerolineae bacterium]
MSKISIRPSTTLYPMSVALVTCGTGEGANIITLAWVGNLCSDPFTIGIGVRPHRYSHGLIKETGEFVVNIPTVEQLGIADHCGTVSGRDVDKWAACGLTPQSASVVKAPLIAQCPINLECQVIQTISLGVHHLFIGKVVAAHVDEALLDEKGKIDYSKIKPFIYWGGDYWELGKWLGTYGYSEKQPGKAR